MAKTCVALHFGNRTLNALALQPLKRGWAVVGGGSLPVPEDDAHDLAPLFKNMARQLKVASGQPATLCLARQQAIIRSVLLPSTDPAELANMARFEAERHIPFNAERHCVGWHIMRSKGVEGSEVLLGAVDGPVVDRGLAALEGGGFVPDGITLPSTCLVNSLLYQQPETFAKKAQAIVSIGLDSLDLIFLNQGRVLYARSAAFDLRGVLESYIGWTPSGDVAHPDAARLATAAHMIDCERLDDTAELLPVKRWIDRVSREIQTTYDFARREMKCPPIESIVLTGEGVGLRNLDRLLGRGGDLPIEILNPVAGLPGAESHKFPFHGLECVIAFGALIGRQQEGAYNIDLTPPMHYRNLAKKGLYRRLAVTGGLLVATLALSIYSYRSAMDIQSQKLRDYKDFNSRMQAQVARLQAMDVKRRILKGFIEDPNAALTVFETIASAPVVPSSVYLEKVGYVKGASVTIEGRAKSLEDLNKLVGFLESRGHFGPIVPTRQAPSPLENKPAYTYALDCPLKVEEKPEENAPAKSGAAADKEGEG